MKHANNGFALDALSIEFGSTSTCTVDSVVSTTAPATVVAEVKPTGDENVNLIKLLNRHLISNYLFRELFVSSAVLVEHSSSLWAFLVEQSPGSLNIRSTTTFDGLVQMLE